jgi:protein phosphatase
MAFQLALPFDVGAATHTGRVRAANEDDFLLLAPQPERGPEEPLLVAIADGMGGAHGGGEASRTAIRALSADWLGAPSAAPARQSLERAFGAACRAVHRAARQSPQLADMGTTLTALALTPARVTIGHIGDTRCLRLRRGRLERLTEDHAQRGADAHLTRCVGAGREAEQADLVDAAVEPGDVFLLASDGLWDVVPESIVARLLRQSPAQIAATRLVQEAVRRGGPDQATAIVLRVLDEGPGQRRKFELPGGEPPQLHDELDPMAELSPPRWPWLLIGLGAALIAVAAARGLFGLDPVAMLLDLLR